MVWLWKAAMPGQEGLGQARQDKSHMPPYSSLNPEQLVCIQRHTATAWLRLNMPVGLGGRWKKHLSGELGKT
jgi:hypothetical protein